MKNVTILHGANETPKSFWLPYVKKELQIKGYDVWIPQLPGKNDPDIKVNLPFALNGGKFTNETIIVGRSAGCPLALSLLEHINIRIKMVILVAGYVTPLPGAANRILQNNYNWKRIRQNVEEIIFINSDNDPWGCDIKQGRLMLDQLGGMLIIPKGEGHFGSDTFNQPYKMFPFLVRLIQK